MHDVTKLRLKLLANGWTPIRNRDKATYMKGWPDLEITPEEIKSWDRMTADVATGIRIENGLIAIDVDVDDEDIVEAIADKLMDLVPALENEDTPWLERHSGKAKVAWFFRTDEPFGKLKTAVFVAPGFKPDDEAAPTGFVEIFGGGSARQFGVFGPHSHEGRNVIREYGWSGRSPLDTAIEELPVITKAQCVDLSHAIAEILKAAGWTIQPLTKFSDHAGGRAFDLPDDAVFDCIDGVARTLAELQGAAGGREPLRCSMSWKEGPQAKNRTRGLVGLTKGGLVFVHDTQDAVTHLPASEKPTTEAQDLAKQTTEEVVTALAAKMKAKGISPSRLKLKHDDDHDAALSKIVQLFAFMPTSPLPVVPIYPEACGFSAPMTLANFRLHLVPHVMEVLGPRGGVTRVNPADSWLADKNRITIDGQRLVPDAERPLFKEKGRQFLNRYDPPRHDAPGGEAETGIALIDHLFPDEAEREWFLDRLAHKLAHPGIPGPALIMVAELQGTGRGTLGRVVSGLIGDSYYRDLDFSDFMGKTYQAQYNEWQDGALIAFINESADTTTDTSKWQNKKAAYEHLKEIADPRPKSREIKQKGMQNYRTTSAVSFFLATNHTDALPLPEEDRRVAVLTNGAKLSSADAQRFNGWADDPANVSAFWRWITARGYRGFDPYAPPPEFAGRRRMVRMAKSDIDIAWEDALEVLPKVFTVETARKAVLKAAHVRGLELPGQAANVVQRIVMGRCAALDVELDLAGRRHELYARTREEAARWAALNVDKLSTELGR